MPVKLSIGRHESYAAAQNLPLDNEGLARAWLSGKVIEEQIGAPQLIIASPLARAQATAFLRAAALGGVSIETAPELDENASEPEVLGFLTELYLQAEQNNIGHIHLVSHAPTAHLLNQRYTPLNCGDILVKTAESWHNMAEDTTQRVILRPVEFLIAEDLLTALKTARGYHGQNLEELTQLFTKLKS